MKRRATLLAVLAAGASMIGCADSEKNGAGTIGESIGRNVTEFAQGVGTGVDAELQIKVELSEALTASGLTATVAKQQTPLNAPDKAISVYFIASKALNATLIAKAYNAENQEIGRATAEVEFGADDAQYISFEFPSEMDRQLVVVYKVDLRTSQPEALKE